MRELVGLHSLILKAARGDPCAEFDIEVLARESLHRYITGHFQSSFTEEDVQEIVNQVIFTIFVHAREYRGQHGDSSARSWVYTIARNQANKWRKVYKQIVPFPDSDARSESGAEADFTLAAIRCNPCLDTDTVEDEALERIFLQQITAVVRELNPRERFILHLYCVEGLTFRQIAARLNVSSPRIRQLMQVIQGKCRGAVGWDSP